MGSITTYKIKSENLTKLFKYIKKNAQKSKILRYNK